MANNKKSKRVDWEPFLAGISHGKTVIEYGASRTIFSQGNPADSVFYLRQGKVKLAVTSHKARKRSSACWPR
jgi:CRP-like cAMP-binding protein